MSTKKYEIVKSESIVHKGRTLYRIKALKTFCVACTAMSIVVKKGELGGFVEFDETQVIKQNIKVKAGQEYRYNDKQYSENVKYLWLTAKDNSDCKIYFQKKTVNYADYKEGMFYISPYEVKIEVKK